MIKMTVILLVSLYSIFCGDSEVRRNNESSDKLSFLNQDDSFIVCAPMYKAVKSRITYKELALYNIVHTDSIISLFPTAELIYHIEGIMEKENRTFMECSNTYYTYSNLSKFVRCYAVFYDLNLQRIRVVISYSFYYDEKELSKYLNNWNGHFFMIQHQQQGRNFILEYNLSDSSVRQLHNTR